MGAKRLILETTSAWSGVIQFYLDSGYQISHSRGSDAYFEKCLAVNAGYKHNQAEI